MLFSKDTSITDIKVKSIYLHDARHDLPDKVFEGESGWVIQGVFSRASFRRQPHGLLFFTVMSLHINNNYAKKRGIGKKLLLTIGAMMLDEQVDLVAATGLLGDAPPMPTTSVSSKKLSPTVTFRCLLAPHRCRVRGGCRVRGQTCVGFSSLRTPMSVGEYGNIAHSPFTTKLWAFDKPTRAAITRYVWLHMDFVQQHNGHVHRERHERRLLLKERSAPYNYSKSKAQSRRRCQRPFAFFIIEEGDHSHHTGADYHADVNTMLPFTGMHFSSRYQQLT